MRTSGSLFPSIIRITFLSLILGLAVYTVTKLTNDDLEYQQEDYSSRQSSTKTLMTLIKRDFVNLQQLHSIPTKLYNVQKIQFFNKSETLNLIQKELENFIKTNPTGKYKLIVDFYSFPDEKNSHLVQFNWINIKTNDKVWEITRVYKLDKKKPDHF